MLALIPARAGSKGVPGKNLRAVGGKSLVVRAVESALAAARVTRVVVSTDSSEIARAGALAGAEVPFLRPPELASDEARSLDVFRYTIQRLEREEGKAIPALVVLQPTSPLRTAYDIDGAIALFDRARADAVVSVTEAPHPIEWHRRTDAGGCLRPVLPRSGPANRQGSERLLLPNGAIYVFRTTHLMAHDDYYVGCVLPYLMPAERSVDVDSEVDIVVAEALLGQVSR